MLMAHTETSGEHLLQVAHVCEGVSEVCAAPCCTGGWLGEPGVLQGFRCGEPLLWLRRKELLDEVFRPAAAAV